MEGKELDAGNTRMQQIIFWTIKTAFTTANHTPPYLAFSLGKNQSPPGSDLHCCFIFLVALIFLAFYGQLICYFIHQTLIVKV